MAPPQTESGKHASHLPLAAEQAEMAMMGTSAPTLRTAESLPSFSSTKPGGAAADALAAKVGLGVDAHGGVLRLLEEAGKERQLEPE